MRAVICGGLRHQSVSACAAYNGVADHEVEEAIYITGRLQGKPIAFDESGPDAPSGEIVHGLPLLASGYCVHRLGTYHGGRY